MLCRVPSINCGLKASSAPVLGLQNTVLGNIAEEDKEDPELQVGTMPSPPRREAREKELLAAYGQLGDANEVLNERAVAVMKRMSDKLTGRDFLQEAISPQLPFSSKNLQKIMQALDFWTLREMEWLALFNSVK